MRTVEWDDVPEKPKAFRASPPDAGNRRRELEKYRSSLDIRSYGPVTQDTLEAMVVATLLAAEQDEVLEKAMGVERDKEAEEIVSSPIRQDWFENKFLGAVFENLRELYVSNKRKRIHFNDVRMNLSDKSHTPDEGENYVEELRECHAVLISRQSKANFMVKRMTNRHLHRVAERDWRTYVAERKDPKIGGEKAIENFRNSVIRDLSDKSGAVIQGHDWVSGYSEAVSRLVDQKRHPDKYTGFKCGIKSLDDRTNGFRPGQLTVFVGAHGGYKSTTMLNVGYGLWERGYNVLYVSLEQEWELVELRLWCRAAKGRLKFTKIFSGHISEPDDAENLDRFEKMLANSGMSDEEKAKLRLQTERIKTSMATSEGPADTVTLSELYEEKKSRKNKFITVHAGQSQKVKCSQIERYLEEIENDFRPQVVVFDYLALIAAENAYQGRRDVELGDICNYMRQMGSLRGFSAITAAQFKRAALDRIREAGLNNIAKAAVGTDDIAESHQIGGAADYVFMLFRKDGGTKLQVLTPKSRYGEVDNEKGFVLQVRPEACMVDDGFSIEDTSFRASQMTQSDIVDALRDREDDEKRIYTPDDEGVVEESSEARRRPSTEVDADELDDILGEDMPPPSGVPLEGEEDDI